jgi:hypothetical protein
MAIFVLLLAAWPAWGHTFPPVRTVVVQVERCEVALLVGYRALSREDATHLVARVASLPKSRAEGAMRELLAAHALAPLTLAVDGVPLVPTAVRAKLGSEGPRGRPMVVLLVTYRLPRGTTLSLTSKDPRATRVSWTDRSGGRVEISKAPAQGRWFTGVASFLLSLSPNTGDSACGTSRSSAP